MADVTGGVGFDVAGDDARVEGCTVTNAGEEGLVVSGLRPVIVKNSVSGMYEEECIVVLDATTGGSVEANRCFDSAYDAISLYNSQMVTVSGNRLERIGLSISAGIYVSGSDNEVSGNSIKDCNGWGLYISGDTNTVDGNKVSGCGLDGLKVDSGSGNVVLGNKLTLQEHILGVARKRPATGINSESVAHRAGVQNEGVTTAQLL